MLWFIYLKQLISTNCEKQLTEICFLLFHKLQWKLCVKAGFDYVMFFFFSFLCSFIQCLWLASQYHGCLQKAADIFSWMLPFFTLSPKFKSCRCLVVVYYDVSQVLFCTKPGLRTAKTKGQVESPPSEAAQFLWSVVHLTANTLEMSKQDRAVFSLLRGRALLEQIAWSSASRARIWMFTILVIALFPVFHVQNILYGQSGGAGLSCISLGYSKVMAINSQSKVP